MAALSKQVASATGLAEVALQTSGASAMKNGQTDLGSDEPIMTNHETLHVSTPSLAELDAIDGKLSAWSSPKEDDADDIVAKFLKDATLNVNSLDTGAKRTAVASQPETHFSMLGAEPDAHIGKAKSLVSSYSAALLDGTRGREGNKLSSFASEKTSGISTKPLLLRIPSSPVDFKQESAALDAAMARMAKDRTLLGHKDEVRPERIALTQVRSGSRAKAHHHSAGNHSHDCTDTACFKNLTRLKLRLLGISN
jgi:hypothetical protein